MSQSPGRPLESHEVRVPRTRPNWPSRTPVRVVPRAHRVRILPFDGGMCRARLVSSLPQENPLSCGKLFSQKGNMAIHEGKSVPQITIENSETALIQLAEDMPDGLGWWTEQYFRFEVTTSPAPQKVQRRDLALFLQYMATEERTEQRAAGTNTATKSLSSSRLACRGDQTARCRTR